ncbi:4'-phosphopantetheinyl transferase superfamily protein [Luteimonas sp. 50]|jgi:4'-phosphopantetheinyl transferase|uniref:4'-phosphopantetheinyl transferase superfamily protein n=1 Tax=Cognatiluteimonas sedimenti TaxID=2927791 RepID=A0ABT0A614_9GAMM|nr:4'-phosphopantetheinyl transferase superfamily protein [Lysobacter sedimenti]MCJ0826409.1 4'-phosphopantetheinyl transferase superfamily protein [Lysobacter sedimenti]
MSLSAPVPAAPQWHWLPWQPGAPAEEAARRWLAPQLQCAPQAIPLLRDLHGRPRLALSPDADVGWSHSGEGLLLAFGRGMTVGVDLERERPRPRALDLARRFFDLSEAQWLEAQVDEGTRAAAFVRLWCAKEAVLKAHGRGLAFGLHRLVFAERDGVLRLVHGDPALGAASQWQLREFVPHPGYRAALAWRPLWPRPAADRQ